LEGLRRLQNGDAFERCVVLTPSKQLWTPHAYSDEHLPDTLLELSDAVLVHKSGGRSRNFARYKIFSMGELC
jgi:hypothetical protein